MRLARAAVVLAVFLGSQAVVAADSADVWIETDPRLPQAGDTVRVVLMQGSGFSGSELPAAQWNMDRLQHVWKSGRTNLAAAGKLQFEIDEAGAQLVAFSSKPQRKARGDEAITRFCKVLFMAGGAAVGGPLHYSEVGQRLEIVPQTDPSAMRERGTFEVQILFDREPLAGQNVRAISHDAPAGDEQRAATDEIGVARLHFDRAGAWLIKVEHRVRCSNCGSTGRERLASTLVLDTGGPRR